MLRIYTVIIIDFVWEIPRLLYIEMTVLGAIVFNCKIRFEKSCIQASF